MKQRCRRQQPSPPSQVLRRAPFWVLFFLSFFFFLLILSCCVSVCVCVCVCECMCVCLGVIALRTVCPCAAARWGPSFVSPSPLLSTHAFSSIHGWWSADGLVMCACVCEVWEGLGRGGVTLLHLTVPFFIGGEGGDWRVYRRRFGEERKVSCARRFLCSYWWADSQWGGDGRCLKLHLLSVTLLALQLQDTSLCFATTKREKKGELHGWSLKTAARLDQETHFLLSPTWTGSFLQFSSGYKTFNFLYFPLKGNRAILLGLVLTTLLGHFLFLNLSHFELCCWYDPE